VGVVVGAHLLELDLLLDVGIGQPVSLQVGAVLGLVPVVQLLDILRDLGVDLVGRHHDRELLADVSQLRVHDEIGDHRLDDRRLVGSRPHRRDRPLLVPAPLLPLRAAGARLAAELDRTHLEGDLMIEVSLRDVGRAHNGHIARLELGRRVCR
jgi:hypothetical protein